MVRSRLAANAAAVVQTSRLIRSIVIALGVSCGAAEAEIFKWVDEDGVTHFSERRPPVTAAVETLETGRKPEPAPSPAVVETAVAPPEPRIPAPPPAPKVCDGDTGATAVGALAMVLNRAYIRSIPEYVADNAATFAADEFYVCLDTIFEFALLDEQVTGGDSGVVAQDAPLVALLEISPTLADAFRGLSEEAPEPWRQIVQHMEVRRPRLDADIGALTQLIRGVIVDAQATRRPAGAG